MTAQIILGDGGDRGKQICFPGDCLRNSFPKEKTLIYRAILAEYGNLFIIMVKSQADMTEFQTLLAVEP